MYVFHDAIGRAMVPRTYHEVLVCEEKAMRRNRTPIMIEEIDEMEYWQELTNLHYEIECDRLEDSYFECV